ncbi:LysM peptidoglycan-binding domain-containing protein, partial [Chloroflexota bacterium]
INNPNRIYVGQKLKIPGAGSIGSGGSKKCSVRHTVKKGEWVYQIARKYGVGANKLLRANNLTVNSANTIYPGMVLCIP